MDGQRVTVTVSFFRNEPSQRGIMILGFIITVVNITPDVILLLVVESQSPLWI